MKYIHKTIVGTAIVVSGALIIAISALAGIDAAFCNNTMVFGNWGGPQDMAIPTAVCLSLIGSALILTASLIKSVNDERQ